MYICMVHAVRLCSPRVCIEMCWFQASVHFACWSCGVLVIRVGEVKLVLRSTLRLLRGRGRDTVVSSIK